MPRQPLSHQQKLRNARKNIQRIISKYESTEFLLRNYTNYRISKKPQLKQFYLDYHSLLRAEKVVQSIERDHNDEFGGISKNHQLSTQRDISTPQDVPTPQDARPRAKRATSQTTTSTSSASGTTSTTETSTENETTTTTPIQQSTSTSTLITPETFPIHHQQQQCENCRRRQHPNHINTIYEIQFYQIYTNDICKRRRFKFITNSNHNTNDSCTLCKPCSVHLTADIKIANGTKNLWPGFIWYLLTNKDILDEYNIEYLWKFIPSSWRLWWSDSIGLRIDYPKPCFRDISVDINDWNNLISTDTLPNLRDACNKYLIPLILCPYGCSAFIHRTGSISIDLIFQRYLPKVEIKKFISNKKYMSHVESTRDDYIRPNNEYDKWLLNEKWVVLPSISFLDNVPYVLTCDDHHKGTNLHIIHPPRQPLHNLPSKYSDQLCHCCIRSRTIKPLKSSHFSTGFQMHEQRGCFNGIDTCNVTTYRNFDFRSKLLRDNEARSIINRPDINALLTTMVEEKSISKVLANDKRSYANYISESFDFDQYSEGATYVPLEHTIIMKQDLLNSGGIVNATIDNRGIDGNGNPLPDITMSYPKYWPSILYPCQKMNKYGATFLSVPSYSSQRSVPCHKLCLCWTLSSLLLSCQELWTIISLQTMKTSSWYGWLLVYLTKNSNLSKGRHANNKEVFKYFRYISTIEKFAEKINIESLEDAFSGITQIFYTNLIEVMDNHIGNDVSNYIGTILPLDIINEVQILLIDSFYVKIDEEIADEILIHEVSFELRVVSMTHINPASQRSWTAEVYSRHGRHHPSWWYQGRKNRLRCHVIDSPNSVNLKQDISYILMYVKKNAFNIECAKEDFLKYLGGQSHVKCHIHGYHLVKSYNNKIKCINCNAQKEYIRCPNIQCEICLCKSCFNNFDENNGLHHTIGLRDNQLNSDDDTEEPSIDGSCSVDSCENNPAGSESESDDGDYLFDNQQEKSSQQETNNLLNDENIMHEEVGTNLVNEDSTLDNLLEIDNFEDYLMTCSDPDLPSREQEEDQHNNDHIEEINGQLDFSTNLFESTNAGEHVITVEEDNVNKGIKEDITISGHVIMNQCGSLLTRKTHQIKGSRKQSFFIQKLCSTSKGSSIPLVYPEGLLFPSIFWKTARDNCSVVGAIPYPLLSQEITSFGFQSIPQHIRARLTLPFSTTSTNFYYTSFSYDMLTNLSANHQDTRLVLRRGLTVGDDKIGGLSLRGQGDSSMLESFDSKAMVRNLCASQLYHNMTHFLTFTCNMRKHFGTMPIKEWVDNEDWKKNFSNYYDLDLIEREEIDSSMTQSASSLLLRVWQEVCQLFIRFLHKSKHSPYKKVLSIFSRNEYQASAGNLSHIHLILEVDINKLNQQEKEFIDDLCRCSVLDIVRTNEIQKYIDDGTFKTLDDHGDMVQNGLKFLGHVCNSRCLVRVNGGGFRCRKLNYLLISLDNTKHTYLPLPNEISKDCLDRLIKIGMVEEIEVNDNGFEHPFKCKLAFLHPQRHIPPTNPNDDINMSPCEGHTFSICRSMQNIQLLTQTGGVNKYICKYIGKIDEQNYIVVYVDKFGGSLVTKATFLHNTKVTSSKINEEKEKKKQDKGYPQGRVISHMEMLHHMLKYPEVITNLNFISIPTMPLEFRAGLAMDSAVVKVCDSAQTGSVSDDIRRNKQFPQWRQHTLNEMKLYEDLKLSKVSVDKITLFSLRPPELRSFIDNVTHYFRWFSIEKKIINGDELNEVLTESLFETVWVDHLQHRVLLRKRAVIEVKIFLICIEQKTDYFTDENDNRYNGVQDIINVFKKIITVIEKYNNNEAMSEDEKDFYDFAISQLIKDDQEQYDHLPVPVFSYIRPNSGLRYIHHLLLSMGRFTTEIDLILHPTIRESLRYCKLIGPSNEPDDLQHYSNQLLYRWIDEQVQYFPNSRRVIAEWIIIAGDLLDSIIVQNELCISDMPPVQLSTLFGSDDEEIRQHVISIKRTFVEAISLELGPSYGDCNVPPKEQIINASKASPLQWNALESYHQSNVQSDSSFHEQKIAIEVSCGAIDKYIDMNDQLTFTKNVAIRGFPGSGKTFCSLYIALYALSKGLFVLSTALLAKRAIQLGGIHYHKLFCIRPNKNISIHRKAELALIDIMKDAKKTHILTSLDVLICDEMGQLSSNFVAMLDIILRRLRDNNLYLGGVLLIGTLDHTQIQAIDSRPFLTSSNLISCFKMVVLENSVRAAEDQHFYRIQQIARYNHKKLIETPELVEEFIDLCSNHLTFVDNWNDNRIPPSTMRLYSKRVPAKEATKQFADRVRRFYSSENLRERVSDDVEKSKFTQQEWYTASTTTSTILDEKLKESKTLLFFVGAIYTCTFNHPNGNFSHSQLALLYELPEQENLDNWHKIKMLVAPPGLKEVIYDRNKSKLDYLIDGFKEIKMGVSKEYTQSIPNGILARRKQYGLKHYVSSTIHSAMGDTLPFMATTISHSDPNYHMWDKGQLVVILSRTKLAKNSIFVGGKEDTLNSFRDLLTRRTQWSDYIEEVLELITINQTTSQNGNQSQTTRVATPALYPFTISNFSLPTNDSGYVYMLVSQRNKNFTYIGTTNCIRTRLIMHNTGTGAIETAPAYLRPFSLYAYVCGFGGTRRDLRYYIERKWKEERDNMIHNNGIEDPRRWAKSVSNVISHIDSNENQFGVLKSELILILLFHE